MPGIEIIAWFQITAMPAGGAPEAVRAQWIGVPLPVRRPRPVEGPDAHLARDVADRSLKVIPDGVVVEMHDAITMLRLHGREEAADWWQAQNLRAALVFRTFEGRLLPPSLAARLFPEVEDFLELPL